jgi:hypothetical protein
MKIITGLFLALFAKAEGPPTFSAYKSSDGFEYIKKSANCKACIDEIGKGTFSNICYGKEKTGDKSVYCCNSSPPEPPLSNAPKHDYLKYLNGVNTYLEYNDENNAAARTSHEYYCPIDNGDLCTPDIKMHLALE